MTRKDKKSTICVCCGLSLATPQKLRQHYASNKIPCQLPASIQVPISVTSQNIPKTTHVIPKSSNDRKPDKTPRTLRACQVLYDTLLQIDEKIYSNIEPIEQTKEEKEFFEEPEIEIENQIIQTVIEPAKKQVIDSPKVNSKISLETDQSNKKFERLSMITGDYEKNIVFKEQNLDDKPGDKEKDKKKNSRTNWLRNKQIIVYNRSEIDDYLSSAFEQILYQVEEREGKSNA
ncbi:16039_t:CDS:2 [Cetraspora pellucida]|uniref:16039_t:CDS:1 n=1 Tax=Cetraspora pellucida TaxID=1433469 RepID=A0ACA9NQ37_9GLOM|nr:16039_t:CDS:2 [Cetraspora pellucida]